MLTWPASRCSPSLRWLQYHDKFTANLPGMLPLAIGMRVALTEHVDRSDDKHLLRGSTGRVHSFVWPENEDRPSIVYVKFDNAQWKLQGVDEPGVYPIRPMTKYWLLDAGKKNQRQVLKVQRCQLPLSPAYAMTAHSSQGKTLAAVLLDLNVESRVDTTFGTVAATRVRSREDVLILRPFPLWLYQRGHADGPSLLLQTLRGEEVDWQAYQDTRAPSATCKHCGEVRAINFFDNEQWEQARRNLQPLCMSCKLGARNVKKRKLPKASKKIQCDQCKWNKVAEAFPRAQLPQEQDGDHEAEEDDEDVDLQQQPPAKRRRCLPCLQQATHLQCCKCDATKPVADFIPEMVTMPPGCVACKACQEEARQTIKEFRDGWLTCRTCKQLFPTVPDMAGRRQRCLNCQSRSTWKENEHTCRNPKCGKKWTEVQTKGMKRQRNCPKCRKK